MAKNGTNGKHEPRKITCIAPGCRKPSKGPRYHYLCDSHRDAKAKQVSEWQSKVKINRKEGTKTAVRAA